MIKRKIAVFGNAWSDEYVSTVLNGIFKGAKEYGIDVFTFLEYATTYQPEDLAQAEVNIFSLPRLEDFDGVLILGNTFNRPCETQRLCSEILEKKIPAISLEYHFDGIEYMGTDNYSGMRELVEHLFQVHKIKSLLWIGGPEDNKENIERFQAVCDVANSYGITIPKNNILCAKWNYYGAQEELKRWMKKYHDLPNAVICANDVMAMGACTYLKKVGINVPEQVSVTGFDHLTIGQTYYPAITSVDRGWSERGYQGIKQLIKIIDSEPHAKDLCYPSTFAIEESCGCTLHPMQKERQLNVCCTHYDQRIEWTVYDWHLSEIDESTSRIKNKDELNQKLSHYFRHHHSFEGESFGIYLDTDFVESFDHETTLRSNGYSEEMEVICSMKKGTIQPIKRIHTRDMLVDYDDSEEVHIYIFVALHQLDKSIGYASLCDKIDMVIDNSLQLWVKHICEGLKRTQQSIGVENLNHKLEQISITDDMTGLYNRLGYEKYAIPHFDRCCNNGTIGAIMVVDINKMKLINDKYGHLNGDIAIKVVAQTIQENLPRSWNAVRYGGDEFVLLGECYEDINIEDQKRKIVESLASKVTKLQISFPLSISIGSVLVEPDQKISMEEYFRMADNAMYQMKKKIHDANGEMV